MIANTDDPEQHKMKQIMKMYAKERAVARYPCMRGPAGRANAEGVLQPWLQPQDKCEP